MNGQDVAGRSSDRWIIDFGWQTTPAEVALYEQLYKHVRTHVEPERRQNRRGAYRNLWWRHVEPRPGMHAALHSLSRYIATSRVAKHRIFVWCHRAILADSRIYVFARDDDVSFGILHSQIHVVWSLATGSRHGDGTEGGRPTYNNQTCFETFPFPNGLTPNIPTDAYADDPRAQRIAAAAARLNELREAWLNPPDPVVRVPEVVPGYPDRILPKDDDAAAISRSGRSPSSTTSARLGSTTSTGSSMLRSRRRTAGLPI